MPPTMTVLLPDVNVLLAAFRADHVHHRLARTFLEQARAGDVAIGLSDAALASVIRLATNARVFVRPDTTDFSGTWTSCWTRPLRCCARGARTGRGSATSAAICACAATASPTATSRRLRSSRARS